MRRFDLHCHSTASDGTDDPAALGALARAAGLDGIALTDHDTLAGLQAARDAASRLGVEVFAGVELSGRHEGRDVHVLGYFVAEDHPGVLAALADLRRGRRARLRAMVQALSRAGVEVTEEEVLRIAGSAAPGRPHVARALVDRGVVASMREAFDQYLAEGRPGHVPRTDLTPAQCVGLVLKAGGVPVLAHPVTVPDATRADLVRLLARHGLQGIEVDHPKHGPDFREAMRKLAREHDLVPTGGSDYHGAAKPDVKLGEEVVGGDVLEALRERGA